MLNQIRLTAPTLEWHLVALCMAMGGGLIGFLMLPSTPIGERFGLAFVAPATWYCFKVVHTATYKGNPLRASGVVGLAVAGCVGVVLHTVVL